MTKSDRETMHILEAFDLTRCPHSAADLAGCDAKTVARYVAIRDAGGDPHVRHRRPMRIDPFRDKVEELVERSAGRIRADVVHERTTRRAVHIAKAAFRAGRRRTYRPWITEPGMWLQSDWAKGPEIDGRPTLSSAPGWPGAASGSCCPPGTASSAASSPASTPPCASSAGCPRTC